MKSKISIFDEIIVDNFAGGGGAYTGIEMAVGGEGSAQSDHIGKCFGVPDMGACPEGKANQKEGRTNIPAVCPPMAEAMVRDNLPEYCGVTIVTMAQLNDIVAW